MGISSSEKGNSSSFPIFESGGNLTPEQRKILRVTESILKLMPLNEELQNSAVQAITEYSAAKGTMRLIDVAAANLPQNIEHLNLPVWGNVLWRMIPQVLTPAEVSLLKTQCNEVKSQRLFKHNKANGFVNNKGRISKMSPEKRKKVMEAASRSKGHNVWPEKASTVIRELLESKEVIRDKKPNLGKPNWRKIAEILNERFGPEFKCSENEARQYWARFK
jgi:hypothetical protein